MFLICPSRAKGVALPPPPQSARWKMVSGRIQDSPVWSFARPRVARPQRRGFQSRTSLPVKIPSLQPARRRSCQAGEGRGERCNRSLGSVRGNKSGAKGGGGWRGGSSALRLGNTKQGGRDRGDSFFFFRAGSEDLRVWNEEGQNRKCNLDPCCEDEKASPGFFFFFSPPPLNVCCPIGLAAVLRDDSKGEMRDWQRLGFTAPAGKARGAKKPLGEKGFSFFSSLLSAIPPLMPGEWLLPRNDKWQSSSTQPISGRKEARPV